MLKTLHQIMSQNLFDPSIYTGSLLLEEYKGLKKAWNVTNSSYEQDGEKKEETFYI